MGYKKVNREFTKEYLQKQHNVMRWLYLQGLTTKEIKKFSFVRNIDEDTREVVIYRQEFDARYFSGLGRVVVDKWDREYRVPIAGSGFEFFLLEQKFVSCFMFTREKPKSWRREVAKSSLYSLSEIEKICAEIPTTAVKWPLTFEPEFGRMKVLN